MTEPTKVRTAFTKDERGILNNWAIEPKMYFEDKVEKKVERKNEDKIDGQGAQIFGLTDYAELLNGRLAMVGITLLVVVELLTGKGFLQIIGL